MPTTRQQQILPHSEVYHFLVKAMKSWSASVPAPSPTLPVPGEQRDSARRPCCPAGLPAPPPLTPGDSPARLYGLRFWQNQKAQ